MSRNTSPNTAELTPTRNPPDSAVYDNLTGQTDNIEITTAAIGAINDDRKKRPSQTDWSDHAAPCAKIGKFESIRPVEEEAAVCSYPMHCSLLEKDTANNSIDEKYSPRQEDLEASDLLDEQPASDLNCEASQRIQSVSLPVCSVDSEPLVHVEQESFSVGIKMMGPSMTNVEVSETVVASSTIVAKEVISVDKMADGETEMTAISPIEDVEPPATDGGQKSTDTNVMRTDVEESPSSEAQGLALVAEETVPHTDHLLSCCGEASPENSALSAVSGTVIGNTSPLLEEEGNSLGEEFGCGSALDCETSYEKTVADVEDEPAFRISSYKGSVKSQLSETLQKNSIKFDLNSVSKTSPSNDFEHISTSQDERQAFVDGSSCRATKEDMIDELNYLPADHTEELSFADCLKITDVRSMISSNAFESSKSNSSDITKPVVSNYSDPKDDTIRLDAVLVKNPIAFMRKALDNGMDVKVPTKRLLFLCLTQTMDTQWKMHYTGYVVATDSTNYLYKLCYTASAKCVRICQSGLYFSLPLAFPNSVDATRCRKFQNQQFEAIDLDEDDDEDDDDDDDEDDDEDSESDFENEVDAKVTKKCESNVVPLDSCLELILAYKKSQNCELAFLCTEQYACGKRILYLGFIVQVCERSHFHRMMLELTCRVVQVSEGKFRILLPLLFPTKLDLSFLNRLQIRRWIANDDGSSFKGCISGSVLVDDPLEIEPCERSGQRKLIFLAVNQDYSQNLHLGNVMAVKKDSYLYEDTARHFCNFVRIRKNEINALLPLVTATEADTTKLNGTNRVLALGCGALKNSVKIPCLVPQSKWGKFVEWRNPPTKVITIQPSAPSSNPVTDNSTKPPQSFTGLSKPVLVTKTQKSGLPQMITIVTNRATLLAQKQSHGCKSIDVEDDGRLRIVRPDIKCATTKSLPSATTMQHSAKDASMPWVNKEAGDIRESDTRLSQEQPHGCKSIDVEDDDRLYIVKPDIKYATSKFLPSPISGQRTTKNISMSRVANNTKPLTDTAQLLDNKKDGSIKEGDTRLSKEQPHGCESIDVEDGGRLHIVKADIKYHTAKFGSIKEADTVSQSVVQDVTSKNPTTSSKAVHNNIRSILAAEKAERSEEQLLINPVSELPKEACLSTAPVSPPADIGLKKQVNPGSLNLSNNSMDEQGEIVSSKRRSKHCGKCAGCEKKNCRKCTHCMDMKKYGGPGRMKQRCKQRVCIFMLKGNDKAPEETVQICSLSSHDASICPLRNCRKCTHCMDMKKYGGPGRMKQRCKQRVCIFMLKGNEKAPEEAVQRCSLSSHDASICSLRNCRECDDCLLNKVGKRKRRCTRKIRMLHEMRTIYFDPENGAIDFTKAINLHDREDFERTIVKRQVESDASDAEFDPYYWEPVGDSLVGPDHSVFVASEDEDNCAVIKDASSEVTKDILMYDITGKTSGLIDGFISTERDISSSPVQSNLTDIPDGKETIKLNLGENGSSTFSPMHQIPSCSESIPAMAMQISDSSDFSDSGESEDSFFAWHSIGCSKSTDAPRPPNTPPETTAGSADKQSSDKQSSLTPPEEMETSNKHLLPNTPVSHSTSNVKEYVKDSPDEPTKMISIVPKKRMLIVPSSNGNVKVMETLGPSSTSSGVSQYEKMPKTVLHYDPTHKYVHLNSHEFASFFNADQTSKKSELGDHLKRSEKNYLNHTTGLTVTRLRNSLGPVHRITPTPDIENPKIGSGSSITNENITSSDHSTRDTCVNTKLVGNVESLKAGEQRSSQNAEAGRKLADKHQSSENSLYKLKALANMYKEQPQKACGRCPDCKRRDCGMCQACALNGRGILSKRLTCVGRRCVMSEYLYWKEQSKLEFNDWSSSDDDPDAHHHRNSLQQTRKSIDCGKCEGCRIPVCNKCINCWFKMIYAKRTENIKCVRVKCNGIMKYNGIMKGNRRKRRSACGNCIACTSPNCRKCRFCLDMKKYGGPGRFKQSCPATRCVGLDIQIMDAKTHGNSSIEELPVEIMAEAPQNHVESANSSTCFLQDCSKCNECLKVYGGEGKHAGCLYSLCRTHKVDTVVYFDTAANVIDLSQLTVPSTQKDLDQSALPDGTQSDVLPVDNAQAEQLAVSPMDAEFDPRTWEVYGDCLVGPEKHSSFSCVAEEKDATLIGRTRSRLLRDIFINDILDENEGPQQ